MNNKLIIKYFFCMLLFIGCSHADDEVISLYPNTTIHELNENYLLTDLRLVQAVDNTFYFNDWSRSHMLILNKDLNLSYIFGQRGEGPGEFQWIDTFNVTNDRIFALDPGGQRVHKFLPNGDLVRTIIPQNLPVGLTSLRFSVIGDTMIFPASVFSESDLVLIDHTDGSPVKEIRFVPEGTGAGINDHIVLTFNDQIVAVNRMIPVIRRVTPDGDLLEEYDLSHIAALDGLWNHYEANKNQQNFQSYTSIFHDAYTDGSYLYVLCHPWPGRDNYAYIIKLRLDEKNTKFDRVFKIQGADSSAIYFRSIAVDGNRLIAVEGSTMTINEYDLSVLN